MGLRVLLLAVACHPGSVGGPVLVAGPVLTAPEHSPLTRRLALTVDRLATLTVHFDDGQRRWTVAFPDSSTGFSATLAGFVANRETLVVVSLEADGVTTWLPPLSVSTDPLPAAFPAIDVVAHAPDRVDPSPWLVSLGNPDGPSWLVVLEPLTLEVIWLYDGPFGFGDARATGDGTFIALYGAPFSIALDGTVSARWTNEEPVFPLAIDATAHHELVPLEDGSMWTLRWAAQVVASYPASYNNPRPIGPATVRDDRIVRVGPDGALLGDWSLADRLDTSRIGFGSLDLVTLGYDWAHANALIPDGKGGAIVSLRHQDALVGFDDAFEPQWILGDPAGWDVRFQDRLLAPTEGTTWPYHAHGPDLAPDGTMVLFDNRSVTHTPYTQDPGIEAGSSRVVAYRVDADAMTVAQVWSWTPAVALLSDALGNAAWLPNGQVLADFGFLDREGDEPDNTELGFGKRHVRLIAFDPTDGATVADVRLRVHAGVAEKGVTAYRAVPIDSLYGTSAVVTVP